MSNLPPDLGDQIAAALKSVLQSPNEMDRNMEIANVVDGLFATSRSIDRLALAVGDLAAGAQQRPAG